MKLYFIAFRLIEEVVDLSWHYHLSGVGHLQLGGQLLATSISLQQLMWGFEKVFSSSLDAIASLWHRTGQCNNFFRVESFSEIVLYISSDLFEVNILGCWLVWVCTILEFSNDKICSICLHFLSVIYFLFVMQLIYFRKTPKN